MTRSLSTVKTLLTSHGPGGSVIRRLFPTVALLLIVLGFLRWEGERRGLYGSGVGVLLLTVAAIGVIGWLLAYFAYGLDRNDAGRRDVEAQLRRSSRHFQLSRDLAVTSGFDGYLKSVNPAVTHILGWSAEEFLGQPFIDLVHPDDRAGTLAEVERLAHGQVTFNFVNRYRRRDGSYCWLDWNAIMPPDEDLIYASAPDITQRKQAEAALAASERQTRQILETAHDAFVSIDAAGLITAWNPQAEASFGWSRDEALGRELAETVIPKTHREAHRRGIEPGRVSRIAAELEAVAQAGDLTSADELLDRLRSGLAETKKALRSRVFEPNNDANGKAPYGLSKRDERRSEATWRER